MTDVRESPVAINRLIRHLVRAEGSLRHFYCDSRGLVTIAVGELMEPRDRSPAGSRKLVQDLMAVPGVEFVHKSNGEAANEGDVIADLRRAKKHGSLHPGLSARAYAPIAQLRISSSAVAAITSRKIKVFADQLYERRPFIAKLDPLVAMALIDARWNPAGVALYGGLTSVVEMWKCLDSVECTYDTIRAVEMFEKIWEGRGGKRYQQRHAVRVEWMEQGLGLHVIRNETIKV